MTLSQGQVLENRYRIVSLLGQGGMGAVYRAWDLNLRIPVALKENLDLSGDSRSQFEHEALMLAQLSHPNLPRVSNHFFVPGQGQYLVMEFIDGQDLAEWLEERGRLTEAEVLPIMNQIASALAYLHSRPEPIIHRDIKPANIKIGRDGRAMLVDFGIAKRYVPQGKTTRGAQAVTPGFSPPEQYGLGSTDARSDVYALGATLYALLTGTTPTESVSRLSGATLAYPANVSPPVARSIMRAMEMEPRNRFQSAEGFAAGLTQPVKSGSRSRAPLLVGVVVVLALLAGSYFVGTRLFDNNTPSATPIGSETGEAPDETNTVDVDATLTAVAIVQEDFLANQAATATAAAATAAVEGDLDGDGLGNDQEAVLGTDPGNRDTDSDGLSDGDEVLIYSTDPDNRDTDGDVLNDFDEIESHRTDPRRSDTDGDGASDGLEITQGSDPLISNPPPDEPAEPPAATLTPTSPPPDEPVIATTTETIGRSELGNPITAYRIGSGPDAVLLIGGLHAGYAPSTVALAERARDHFSDRPEEVPDNISLYVIPNASPDSPHDPGNLPGRLNANGVDLNRNWDCNWSANAVWTRGGQSVPVGAGSAPFSEAETQVLRIFIEQIDPVGVVAYEARATNGLVAPGNCLGTDGGSMALATEYNRGSDYTIDTDLSDNLRLTGDSSDWMADQNIPSVAVLLEDYESYDWTANLAGIRAVLDHYRR